MTQKGQAIGQVFIYIIVALTFALITIFGYKAIEGFLEKSEQVAFVSFKTELETTFSQITPEYGSVRLLEFRTPIGFRKICFVDVEADVAVDNPQTEGKEGCNVEPFDPIACDQWRESTLIHDDSPEQQKKKRYEKASQNVFLSPPAEFPIKVSRLRTRVGNEYDFDYLCLPVINGHFNLRLEGQGSHVLIQPGN